MLVLVDGVRGQTAAAAHAHLQATKTAAAITAQQHLANLQIFKTEVTRDGRR
jgi:hypothetical protein